MKVGPSKNVNCKLSLWNGGFVVLKHFACESLHVEPFGGLDIVLYNFSEHCDVFCGLK